MYMLLYVYTTLCASLTQKSRESRTQFNTQANETVFLRRSSPLSVAYSSIASSSLVISEEKKQTTRKRILLLYIYHTRTYTRCNATYHRYQILYGKK